MHSKKILCILCSLFYGVLSRRPGPDNRPPPPPPPPHPPMPPIPVPSNSTEPMPTSESSHPIPPPPPPLIPHALLPNQCSFGVESAADTTDDYAEANTLYILAGDPAECSGTIDSLFFCFSMSELVRYSKHTIQFISFRQHYSSDGDLQSYRKLGRAHVDIEVNEESGGIACRIIKPNDTLSLSAGDVLGFVTEQGFHIALTNINDTHIFQFMPFEDELESIPATQSTTQQVNNTATPVLKIVMNTTRPTSSYLLTTPTPNPNGDHSSGKSTISILVLASVVIVSAVIVALTIMVFTLCCCLCGWCMCCDGCMHFKSKVYQHCQQKGKTTQKVSGILDQSMQYNDMYLPKDPDKVITTGLKQSVNLHWNPAYNITSHSSFDRLDRTYESIEVSGST